MSDNTYKPGDKFLLPVELMHQTGHTEVTADGAGWFFGAARTMLLRDLSTLIPITRLSDLEAENARLREALATWMIRNSYPTGHGDTFDDLLIELDFHHSRLREHLEDAYNRLARLMTLLRDIEPHLDSIVCYASTVDEHIPNRIVRDIRAVLTTVSEPSS